MGELREPSIAVVIPNYNRPHLVKAAVRSVLEQTRPADEIVVIDDGSRDRSEGAIREFGERVRYIYQENRGLPGARNTGIRETCSGLLVFLDDDDLLEPVHLESLALALGTKPEAAVAYGDVGYTDLEGRELGVHSEIVPEIRDAASLPRNMFCFRCFPPIHSAMFRREVFEEHGLFNETYPYAEDVEMWLRLAPYLRFAFVDRIVCRYRKHESNMVRDLCRMEEQHTRGLVERLTGEDLPEEYRRLGGTAFANLCLTHMGHYGRAGERGQVVRCLGRVRRAWGGNAVAFWGLLVSEYVRRRMVRRARPG